MATHFDRFGGTHVDPPEVERPGTRMLGGPVERPGTRVLSAEMMGGLLDAPMPARPVEEIAPPPVVAPMPEVLERYGVRFVSGADNAAELLDDVHRRSAGGPGVLVVGGAHTGQRRITRLIARTLADAGVGDGMVRTADGEELSGDPAQAVAAELRNDGPPLLFERLDAAILNAPEPGQVAAIVTRARAASRTTLIATCDEASYERLAGFGDLLGAFRVFRLPDLDDLETRLALLHVLADERRVTIDAAGLDAVRKDLPRLRGRGDLVNSRLVESYLDHAVAKHTDRAGAARDRLVLVPKDFAGVAEALEPSLRPAGDVAGYLRTLDEMVGLAEAKGTVADLIGRARGGADPGNLIFLGEAGTGKRTVAGLIGGAYAALGRLTSGHVVACNARDFGGDDPAAKVTVQADRAGGGVLLIEDAQLLDRMSAAAGALLRLAGERRGEFLVVCASRPGELDGFLIANPAFAAEFGVTVEFGEPTDRQLVQMFTRFAERDLYLLDEELRVELLGRFGEMRGSRGFAYADTVRRLFEQIVARQAARLAGGQVNAATVARLTVRDLPETPVQQMLHELHQDRR